MGQNVAKVEHVAVEESVDNLDLSGRDLSVTGASEMHQLGEKYASLKTLLLKNCQLTYLENIVLFSELETLDLSRNLLTNLEDEKNEVLFFLKNLMTLNLAYNYLTNMPSLIFNLSKLSILNLSNNNIAIIADEIGMLENLTDLDISFNQLAFLPDTLINLTKLAKLKINSNELKELPGLAPSVIFLNLNDNLLKSLPPSIGLLAQLKKLYVDNNELLDVPTELGKLTSLRELNLNYNQLVDLPQSLGTLTELTILDISDNLFEAKEWYDPEVPSLLNFIRTKSIKPSRNGKFKSKKRRQDTLRLLPTQRRAGTSNRPKLSDSSLSDSAGTQSTSTAGSSNNNLSAPNHKDSTKGNRKSVPGAMKPASNVFLKLYRFKNIDDVSIGDAKSIVMVDRVVCDFHVLDASDVYLLDSPDAIWIWVGPHCHPHELMKAKHVAEMLNTEFGANLPVHILDKKSMLSWEHSGEFWLSIGVLNESDSKSFVKLLKDPKALAKAKSADGYKSKMQVAKRASATSDAFLFSLAPPSDDKDALSFRLDETKIYKFDEGDDERVHIHIVSAGEPPVKSILDSSSCFLLDIPHNPSVYVWAGAYSSPESKSWALLKAEEVINRDMMDSGVERAVAWNLDDAETWDFKELFFDWLDIEWDPVERQRIQEQREQNEKLIQELEEEARVAVESVKLPLHRDRQLHHHASLISEPVSPSSSSNDLSTPRRSASELTERQLHHHSVPVAAADPYVSENAQTAADREAAEKAEREELERLEQVLVEKRRKQAQDAAAAAAAEAKVQAEQRRAQAQKEAEEAEAKRRAERERAAAQAKAAAEAKAAADAKALAEAKAAAESKAKRDAAEKQAAAEREAKAKAEFEAAAQLMSLPPASRPTPKDAIKGIEATIIADKKQADRIMKLWRPPTLNMAKVALAIAPISTATLDPQSNALGEIPESRSNLLAGPRRAMGPQGRRAATTNQAAQKIETKSETASNGPKMAVGGAFGLLRAVGGDAALASATNRRTEAKSSSSSKDSQSEAQIFQKGNPRLIWIKGRRKILIRLVPIMPASLNSGDVFILDNGKGVLYQWNGKDANRIEKGKGMDLAKNIKDKEYSGTAKVVVLEEGKTDTNVTDPFWKILHGHVANADLDAKPATPTLPLPSSYAELKIKSAEAGGDDSEAEAALKTSCDLYKLVPGKKERVEPELVSSFPLKKDVLLPEECYILDCLGEIYVWCGKTSPLKTRKQSLDVALKLMASRSETVWVAPIIRELPGGESVMFREKFSDWGYGPPIQMQKVAVGKNVAKRGEAEKIDVAALYAKKAEREEVMVDTTGNGEVHIWRIEDFKKVPVPREFYGHFYAGDTFIILYKYKVGNREAFLVYYWQGRTATINEKGTSALLTIELDKEFKANGTAKEVRVVQNQEPKHFLLVFKDKYIIHAGKFVEHSTQTKRSDGKTSLYEVCGTSELNTRLIQLETASKASFKSNASFVAVTSDRKTTYTWTGAYSPECLSKAAQTYAPLLAAAYGAPTTPTGTKEGSEPSKFWSTLNDSDKQYPKWSDAKGQARLFHASEASGQFRVAEVPAPFSREDLTRNDCYILDAWDRMYLWQNRANPGETKQSLETAVAYYDLVIKERGLEKAKQRYEKEEKASSSSTSDSAGPIAVVTSGKEPLVFTSFFMAWTPLPSPSNLAGDLASGTQYLSQFTTKYSFEDLVEKRYPPGVDTTKLEDLLDDDEFERGFEMTREAFMALPGWQAQKLKKSKGLF